MKHVVPGDGACLFHSFSKGMTLLDSPVTKHALELRAIAVEHMEKHKDEYLTEWDGKTPSDTPCDSFDSYLELIMGQHAYGSTLEIRALARESLTCESS